MLWVTLSRLAREPVELDAHPSPKSCLCPPMAYAELGAGGTLDAGEGQCR
jgi:hypothetical protein